MAVQLHDITSTPWFFMFSYCIAIHRFQISAMIQKFIKLSIYRLIRAYYIVGFHQTL